MIRLNSMNHSPFKKFSTVLHHASTDMHYRIGYKLKWRSFKDKKKSRKGMT